MATNAIKSASIADNYMDVTRNGRYQRWEYDNAFNAAIRNFVDGITGTEENPVNNYQLTQTYQDNLYNLQKTLPLTPSTDIVLYPTDYRSLDSVFATIGGVSYYCRPTTQNKLGPLLIDSFRAPSDIKPYYLQDTVGFKIYHGPNAVTNVDLSYIRQPAYFTIGTDAQLIQAGSPLFNTGAYTAVDVSVQNGTTYNIGDEFVAVGTVLTSGTVILSLFTTAIDLPPKTQDQISKMAAEILLGQTQAYEPSAFAEKEAKQS